MPQVLAPLAKLAAVTIFSTNAVVSFISRIAVSVLLSHVSSRLFGPKPAAGVGFTGMQTMARGGLEFRKIVYGQAMVSGPVVYNVTAGSNNQDLWYVIPLCHGESEDLVSLWFDNEEIPAADIAWTPGTGASDGTGTAAVSTARWVGDSSATAVYCRYYLGDDAQPACGALVTAVSEWTSSHRLRGITYLAVRLVYTPDTEEVWDQGAPRDIKAVIQGRKIYDPRLDTTNGGSGSHRYTDSTTWEWSENPALCVADYLVNFVGVDPATGINWTSVADAADDCEVSVDIPTSSSEDRFTCNGALSLGASHVDNLRALLSSMAGRLGYSSGQWTVRASVWESTSFAITEDDIIGAVELQGSAPRAARFNTVEGYFADPDRSYQFAEFPVISVAEFVTRDAGKTLTKDIELLFTNSNYMAQRIAYRELEQADNQVVVSLNVNKMGADIAIGDTGTVTISELGWSAKTFRCIEWSRLADGTFALTLQEDQASSYTDPLEGEYASTLGSTITVPAVSVAAPSGLTATAIPNGIRLDWTNPASRLFDWIDVYASATNAWAGASLVASTRANHLDIAYDYGTTRYFWVRARSFANVESIRNPNSDTSTVTATAGAAVTGVVRLAASYYMHDDDVSGGGGSTEARAGFVFKTDGRILVNSGGTELATFPDSMWWSNAPEADIGDDYEVRCVSVSSGSWSSSAASVGSWVALTSDRAWTISRTDGAGIGTNSVTAIFEVRPTASSGFNKTEASTEMTAEAEITSV